MQLVGRSCEVCKEPVKIAIGVEGCRACDLVFHRSCVTDATTCANCGRNFRAEALALRDAEHQRAEEVITRGKNLATIVISLLVLLSFAGLVASFMLSPTRGAAAGVRLLIEAAILWALWAGRDWARVLVGGTCALIAPVAIVFAVGYPEIRAVLVIAAIVTGGVGALLIFSRDLRAFLDARRLGLT